MWVAKKKTFSLDQGLFSKRLCDLQLQFQDSWLEALCKKVVFEELQRAKKIFIEPQFYISDEWFCYDGTTTIGIPFYLFDKKLQHLEKKFMGFSEGSTPHKALKLIRHEIGHVVENAFDLKDHPLRVQTFQSSYKKYPSSYSPTLYSRDFVKHLGDGYAQSHPDEDFAETFAVWLTPDSDWEKQYRYKKGALQKLKVMEQLMKDIRYKKPKLLCFDKIDDITTQTQTLKTYFLRKKSQHHNLFSFEKDLKYHFSYNGKQTLSLCQFVKNHRKKIVKQLSKVFLAPQYQFDPLISKLYQSSKSYDLRLDKPVHKNEKKLLDLLAFHFIRHTGVKGYKFNL